MDTTSSPEDRSADSGNTETPTGSTPDATEPTALGYLPGMMRSELEETLTRATEHLTHARAELERLRAPISDGADARLVPFWDKARRIATSAGYCGEFDRIASALGGPQRRLSWEGAVSVEVTVSVDVPVSGIDGYQDVQDGDVNYDITSHDVAEALSEADISHWDVTDFDTRGIEIHHTEDAEED